MNHLPPLISDLTLILIVAGITTLLFKKLNQPVVLGYILAGFLVGPNFNLIPGIADEEGIKAWSEIGVIFLLFSLGLEFSFKKLAQVGGPVFIAGIMEISLMLITGYTVGQLMGWSQMDSLFLGAIISMSSTIIIFKSFTDMGLRSQKFTHFVFGILVLEDVIAVVLMVLLSTIAVSREFEGAQMAYEIVKLSILLVLWFVSGIYILPTFLKRVSKLLNDETLLVVSVALCLMMVLLAVEAGFSLALGAFIMGSILAETRQAERIEHLTRPLKDLFAAVFFVSVGMIIDPTLILDYWWQILLIIALVFIGKIGANTIGILLSGERLRTAVQTGFSMAQVGELSFIIASLGISLKVTSQFLYPIAVAVSAATALTTPFLIKRSENVAIWLEGILPERISRKVQRYTTGTRNITQQQEWKALLKKYFTTILINTVIIIVVIFVSNRLIHPFITVFFNASVASILISAGLTLLMMAVPLYALVLHRIDKKQFASLWVNKNVHLGPVLMLEIGRVVLGVILVGLMLNTYFSVTAAMLFALVIVIPLFLFFSKRFKRIYDRLELRFLKNLNERENLELERYQLAPWDAHFSEYEIYNNAPLVGHSLLELRLREKYGVNIALIERGALAIISPSRYERLYPGDKISVIGTDQQLRSFQDELKPVPGLEHNHHPKVTLQQLKLNDDYDFIGKTIRESGIREKVRCLVVGIENNKERILNPESDYVFQSGDTLWLVGYRKDIEQYIQDHKLQLEPLVNNDIDAVPMSTNQ